MYECLAKHYNLLMKKDFDYATWRDYLLEFLGDRIKGVDLCCGTGVITNALAAVGKKMTGVDVSPEMLAEAMKNKKNHFVEYVCADVAKLRLTQKYDFVLSTCDGMNYISDKDLPKLFSRVFTALNTDGLFLFDVSTEYKLREVLGDNVFFREEKNTKLVWENFSEKNRVDMRLTFFERVGNGKKPSIESDAKLLSCKDEPLYTCRVEEHSQYIHSIETLSSLLTSAGFSVEIYDFVTRASINDKTERIQFVCKK